MNIEQIGYSDAKCISHGSYGYVFRAKDHTTGKSVAIKAFKEILGEPNNSAKTEKDILQQIKNCTTEDPNGGK